jgi:hypothetical protein
MEATTPSCVSQVYQLTFVLLFLVLFQPGFGGGFVAASASFAHQQRIRNDRFAVIDPDVGAKVGCKTVNKANVMTTSP